MKQNKASEQKALNYYPSTKCDLLLHLPVHHLPVHHLPICHLPQHNTSSSSEMKENGKNCVQNMSINCLGLSIPEHVVWHSEWKWLLHKTYWIFLNAFLTVRPLDSLLHFGIQLINIKILGLEIVREYLQVQNTKLPLVRYIEKEWWNQNRVKIPAFNKNIQSTAPLSLWHAVMWPFEKM